MLYVIVVAVIVVVAVAGWILVRSRAGSTSAPVSAPMAVPGRVGPVVAEFHMVNGTANVYFDVPLAPGEVDRVLADLLIREAIEVVREKRHTLPLGDLHTVVAFGHRVGQSVRVGTVELDTPGTLPPPMVPTILPHAHRPGFDAFEKLTELPDHIPGLADRAHGETLAPLGPQLHLPAAVDAGLRAQGLDPMGADATDLALGVMRLAGYTVIQRATSTYDATRAGQRVFVRTVEHDPADHPELDEKAVGRFVVDFVSSGADRGLLITEKFSPFEIYDRERREPRMRFVTRERFQGFMDALSVG